jgi:dTDP-4-amino-4,6-dideoxygalactose transaminase
MEALKQLVLPWKWWSWKRGRAVGTLEDRFARYHGVGRAYAVGSGREALYLILKSLGLKENDEIILQSFTCMVVVNSIVWNGLKPVYCDTDESFNLNPEKLESIISSKTKAVIVQHTFGIPAQLEKIQKICRERNLILIEDCAHALGAEINGKKVGTMADFGFYSLGRSKVISAVSGGMIICNNNKFLPELEREYAELKDSPTGLIFQNLMHPIICSLAKATYGSGLGKLLMVAGQKLKLLSYEVTKSEKRGIMKKPFPCRMPNALAELGLIQFGLLDKFNEHRYKLAKKYFEKLKSEFKKVDPQKFPGAVFLRYPVLVKNPEDILKAAKRQGIILGNWNNVPVAPADIDQSKSGYKKGENLHTENICQQVVNLPTQQNINEKDSNKIINFMNKNV